MEWHFDCWLTRICMIGTLLLICLLFIKCIIRLWGKKHSVGQEAESVTDSSCQDYPTLPGEEHQPDFGLSGRVPSCKSSCTLPTTRLLLVGKTGSGKSATGNTILGKTLFKSQLGASVTKTCRLEREVVFNRWIQIMDTPGLFDTSSSDEDIVKEVLKALLCLRPGPHAILFCHSLTNRFTEEDYNTFNRLKFCFGENFTKFTVMVLTYGELLEGEESVTVEDVFEKWPPRFKQVLEKCGQRYVVFDNRSKDLQQVNKLIRLIDGSLNGNLFTHPLSEELRKFFSEQVKLSTQGQVPVEDFFTDTFFPNSSKFLHDQAIKAMEKAEKDEILAKRYGQQLKKEVESETEARQTAEHAYAEVSEKAKTEQFRRQEAEQKAKEETEQKQTAHKEREEAEQKAREEKTLKEEEQRKKEEAEQTAREQKKLKEEEQRKKEEAEQRAREQKNMKEEEQRKKEEAEQKVREQKKLKEEAQRKTEEVEKRARESERKRDEAVKEKQTAHLEAKEFEEKHRKEAHEWELKKRLATQILLTTTAIGTGAAPFITGSALGSLGVSLYCASATGTAVSTVSNALFFSRKDKNKPKQE